MDGASPEKLQPEPASGSPTTSHAPTDGSSVFLSYSHEDKFWKDWLLAEPPLSLGDTTIDVWSDDLIFASAAWRKEIETALETAQVAVLLVSESFLASPFIREVELSRILVDRERQQKRVIWVSIDLTQAELKEKNPELASIQSAWPIDDPLKTLEKKDATGVVMDGVRSVIYDHILQAIDREWWRARKVIEQIYPKRYRLLQRLADGIRYHAYVARDNFLKRDVTITTFKDTSRADAQKALGFATQMDDLNGFLTVYDASLHSNPQFYVRQFVEGVTLAQLLAKGRRLDYDFALHILVFLAELLQQAHERRFFHLNVKPSNVIVDYEDRLFLSPLSRRGSYHAQFVGVWEEKGGDAEDNAPWFEDVCYAVPELFGNVARTANLSAVDQYLLGLLGYHMVTGQAPIRLEGRQKPSFADFKKKPLPPIRSLPGSRHCPALLATTIERMTSIYPECRYDDLHAVLKRLRPPAPSMALAIAKDSYLRVITRSNWETEVMIPFYEAFKKRSPVSAPHFQGVDMERQNELVKEAILSLFLYAELEVGRDREPTVLSRIAERHRERRIPVTEFRTFAEELQAHFVAADPAVEPGTEERDQVCRAWELALREGLAYLEREAGVPAPKP